MDSIVDLTHGKLVTNQEGPYIVTGVTGTGAYYLKDQDERDIPNPSNMSNLRKYYYQ